MAEIILIDNAPDFTTDAYKDAREAMKSRVQGLTDDVAAASLLAAWKAQKEAEALARQQQEEQEAAVEEERRRREREDEEIARAADAREREAARKEEEKKNSSKYVPVAVGVGMPDDVPLEVAPAVMRNLASGKWVALYHFTNEAVRMYKKELEDLTEDDAVRLVTSGDGGFSLVQGGARSKVPETKKTDDELSWEEFQIAVMRFLEALRVAGWREDRQRMFGEFFAKIQTHPWRTSDDKYGIKSRALLLYAAQQRKLWHQYITMGITAVPDISVLNEDALRRAKDDAYDRHRQRVDQVAQRVSTGRYRS